VKNLKRIVIEERVGKIKKYFYLFNFFFIKEILINLEILKKFKIKKLINL
jgi:hypothetical protein